MMMLIGQYDSSFVRRVAIAMTLYSIHFEHRPWSVFSDAEKIREYNPLLRVPTLVLEDGTALVESHTILDYVDSLVSPEERMFPRDEPLRHQALRVAALATGLADKTVSLFYERRLHEQTSRVWEERCRGQIVATLHLLERECAATTGEYWFGDRMGHADVAVVCALRHMRDSHADLASLAEFPALEAFSARLEAMPVFEAISQPFLPPA